MPTAQQILKQYWGYDEFRSSQQQIIQSVLDGHDTLALLPTGGGKSICFQVPALLNEGICLVISPLIALMKDQVENLRRKGILALSIYSGMSFPEVKKTLQNAAYGNYKFLYVSPERLETDLFLEFLPLMKVNLVAVDEAHCISQWGYDFRPPYRKIALLKPYLPGVAFLALTASATLEVQNDICAQLGFGKDQQRFQQSFERPNLSYSLFNVASKQIKLLEILKSVNGSALVYCRTRKHTRDIAELLAVNKINADYYHAGLNNNERNKRQENWINDKTRVIACTNAFGMGIDKPNVRVVVHYGVPDCLENYYQEAGRAGRDGKRAYAVLLCNDRELDELQLQPGIRFPGKDAIKEVYTAIMNYLQVAAGSGEGSSFDFDIAAFSKAFKINILTATFALKALEQEDIVRFNEVFFKPSTLVFTTDKASLFEFEKQAPALDKIIKGLLRSYEGIFDFPAIIYENELAKFIGIDITTLKNGLAGLQRHGILAYSPQSDAPRISLVLNRMYADSIVINLELYLERKKVFEQRIQSMLAYSTNREDCRSRMIAAYFNDHTVKPCGICDNCISKKDKEISKEEFEQLSRLILDRTGSTPVMVDALFAGTGGKRKEKLWKVINFLQAERKLEVSKDGSITRKVQKNAG